MSLLTRFILSAVFTIAGAVCLTIHLWRSSRSDSVLSCKFLFWAMFLLFVALVFFFSLVLGATPK